MNKINCNFRLPNSKIPSYFPQQHIERTNRSRHRVTLSVGGAHPVWLTARPRCQICYFAKSPLCGGAGLFDEKTGLSDKTIVPGFLSHLRPTKLYPESLEGKGFKRGEYCECLTMNQTESRHGGGGGLGLWIYWGTNSGDRGRRHL